MMLGMLKMLFMVGMAMTLMGIAYGFVINQIEEVLT